MEISGDSLLSRLAKFHHMLTVPGALDNSWLVLAPLNSPVCKQRELHLFPEQFIFYDIETVF